MQQRQFFKCLSLLPLFTPVQKSFRQISTEGRKGKCLLPGLLCHLCVLLFNRIVFPSFSSFSSVETAFAFSLLP